MPYKRFAAPCLLALASRYLHEPRTTYRSVIRHDRCLIGYPLQTQDFQSTRPGNHQPPEASRQDHANQSVIWPSLVWHFLGWLGSLTLSLDKAREMIVKHNPNSLCHRTAGSVDPHKARSEDRQRTLETARQLLLIMPEWEDCFACQFFPRFATRAGFG